MTTTAQAMQATAIIGTIRGFLMLQKDADTPHNALSIMGLFTTDFPSVPNLIWDETGVTAQTKMFKNDCTCSAHPKEEKTVRMEDTFHAPSCDQARAHHILMHPCLTAVEDDGDDMTWTFQWPRDIEAYRNVIMTRFDDAGDDDLWPHWKASWAKITAMMPEMEFSLAEKSGAASIPEEDWTPVEEDAFDMDFGSPAPIPEENPEPTPAPAPKKRSKPTIEVVHGAGDPVVEAIAQEVLNHEGEGEDPEPPRRRPGRPKGTSAAAREAKKELSPEDVPVAVTLPGGQKVIPACVRFAEMCSEEMESLMGLVHTVAAAESFPIETIRTLKRALDRLALRTAHLEHRGLHELGDPRALNPMVEVSLENVTAQANTAIRDLGLSAEKPASWEAFKKDLKEVIDVADSMFEVMSQMGMAPVIMEASTTQAKP